MLWDRVYDISRGLCPHTTGAPGTGSQEKRPPLTQEELFTFANNPPFKIMVSWFLCFVLFVSFFCCIHTHNDKLHKANGINCKRSPYGKEKQAVDREVRRKGTDML